MGEEMRKFIVSTFFIFFSFLISDTTFSTPGTVTITSAGTYHFTGAGTYTINFDFPSNAYNKKVSQVRLIGGGGGGGGGGGSSVGVAYAGYYLINTGAGGGGGGHGYSNQSDDIVLDANKSYRIVIGVGGSGGSGGPWPEGAGSTGGNGEKTSFDIYDNDWQVVGAANGGAGGSPGSGPAVAGTGGAGAINGGNGGAGPTAWVDFGGGGAIGVGAVGNPSGYEPDPIYGNGGNSGTGQNAGVYTGSAGTAGNSGYAKIVISYLIATENYYFKNSAGSTTNISTSEEVSFIPSSYFSPASYLGHVTINQTDLGVNIFDNDFSNIVIAKDTNNNPYVSVPAGSDLATAVNGNSKWVPIKLGPFTKRPVIKYSSDGNTYTAIVDYAGIATSDNIRNYSFDGEYVTFEVNHFSTYGTAVLDSVEFTDTELATTVLQSSKVITVNVLDNMGEGIENAPVTFSIQSGSGLLDGSSSDKVIYTNANGVATINYTYPNQKGANIVRAEVDGVFDTIIMNIPGGLTAQELALYNAWAAGYPGLGAQQDDPDGDGLTNLKEWNYGSDSTNPLVADSDSDGLNDKWDAAPNTPGSKVFYTLFNPDIAATENFTGNGKDLVIIAVSTNLSLTTLVDVGYSKNASSNALADDIKQVLEINGLAKESVRDGNLAFSSTDYTDNYYKALKPGEAYSVLFAYINRGNDTDSYGTTINLEQTSTRWTTSYSNSGLNNVAPWQRAELEVSVLPSAANAFERTTLNVEIGYDAGDAVSYNRYPSAFAGNSFANEGYYGGDDSYSYQFLLQAEGYDLKIINRVSTINMPSDYTGTPGLVPGAKIIYEVALYNNSSAVATSINLTDNVPNSCHLYYTPESPTINGTTLWAWRGETSNEAGPASTNAINFEITVPARSVVTASYTVTVD